MRILLDECVPVQLRGALPEHEVTTAPRMGWAGMANGALLNLAEAAGFEVFIAADENLRYQQNLSSRRIAILELWTNHRPTLERHFAEIRAMVEQPSPAQCLTMSAH
jgi:hypothetical protein